MRLRTLGFWCVLFARVHTLCLVGQLAREAAFLPRAWNVSAFRSFSKLSLHLKSHRIFMWWWRRRNICGRCLEVLVEGQEPLPRGADSAQLICRGMEAPAPHSRARVSLVRRPVSPVNDRRCLRCRATRVRRHAMFGVKSARCVVLIPLEVLRIGKAYTLRKRYLRHSDRSPDKDISHHIVCY